MFISLIVICVLLLLIAYQLHNVVYTHPRPKQAKIARGGTYFLTIGKSLDKDITDAGVIIGASRSETIRRAFALFSYASKAKKVVLIQEDDSEVVILVK